MLDFLLVVLAPIYSNEMEEMLISAILQGQPFAGSDARWVRNLDPNQSYLTAIRLKCFARNSSTND